MTRHLQYQHSSQCQVPTSRTQFVTSRSRGIIWLSQMTAKNWKRLQCAILIFFLPLWVAFKSIFFQALEHFCIQHVLKLEKLFFFRKVLQNFPHKIVTYWFLSQVQTVSISYLRCLIEHVRCYILDRDIELVYYTIRKSSDVLTRDPMQLGAQVNRLPLTVRFSSIFAILSSRF